MASLALDFDSPHFEYFPPTPSASDDEIELVKPTAEKFLAMSNGVPNALPATIPKASAVGQTAPSKVTLHLGHLPSKKDIKGPWPRTPTRVSSSMPSPDTSLTYLSFRSTQIILRGLPTVDTMSTRSHTPRWVSAYPPSWVKLSTTSPAL